MKFLILSTMLVGAVMGQTDNYQHDPSGDTGVAYVHNPAWDLTPFERYKLRKAAEREQQAGGGVALPASAPVQNEIGGGGQAVLPKRVKAVRRPAPQQQQQQQQHQQALAIGAGTRASGLGQPTFQNFQPRNVAAAQPPRPQPQQQLPAFRQQPAAPRQQQPVLQQREGAAAFQQVAFFGQQQQQQQQPQQQQQQFFQAAPAARAAPRAPARAAARFQAVPATPTAAAAAAPAAAAVQTAQFIADSTRHPDPNFWNRAYEYTAADYAAKAAGSSYTYVANL